MKVVQIKGSNGSGKSTIPLQLLAKAHIINYIESPSKLTILDDLGWVLIGPYSLDAGPTSNGCDNIGKVQRVKDAIILAMKTRPNFNILFEGMMISTIKSTFYEFLLELEFSHDVQPLFVILNTAPDKCIERLNARGTRRPSLNVDNIRNKCEGVVRHAKTYDQRYVRWMYPDKLPKRDMLTAFLALIDDDVEDDMESEYMSYMDIVKMKSADVIAELDACGYDDLDILNQLELRRMLILDAVEPLTIDRSDIIPAKGVEPNLFSPWNVRNTEYPPVYEREAGYRSSTNHDMSLIVMVHQLPRGDIPLLTEWEQVSSCRDCKGAGGACPGLSPRFDIMSPSSTYMYVVTVSMDYCWALEYGSRRSWYMLSSYIDMITISYMNRLVSTLDMPNTVLLGAHNCPGKCKDCVALRTGKCGRKQRRFSMEAVGIDCDELHLMFYDEWMPWAYKGHAFAPTYMTRYAGWLGAHKLSDQLSGIMDSIIAADKTYIPLPDPDWLDEVYQTYADVLKLVTVPAGVHKGCAMWTYDFKQLGDDE